MQYVWVGVSVCIWNILDNAAIPETPGFSLAQQPGGL